MRAAWNRIGTVTLAACVLLLCLAAPALADTPDAVKTAKRADPNTLSNLILIFVAIAFLWLGIGAAMATLRVIVPGLAARTDRAVEGLGAGRLFLSGILPLVGLFLLGFAVEKSGSRVFEHIYVIGIAIPFFLALLAGAMGALPYLGAKLLKDGESAGLLKQSAVGGAVVGLAGATWVLPPVGMFMTFIVSGWLVGIGLGAVFPPPLPESD